MTDDDLTDAWLAAKAFPGGISHERHLRIARVLHCRHEPDRAEDLLVSGTRPACEVHACAEKFDEALPRRWFRAVAEVIARDGPGDSARAFLDAHEELMRGDLFGRPRATA